MTNLKPRCEYLGCEPVQGQCLGFCEGSACKSAPIIPIQFAGSEPLDSTFEYPDSEQDHRSMKGLAWAIVISFVMLCIHVGVIAYFW